MTQNTCDDDMTDHHANCSHHQESSAPKTIDEENSWEGKKEVDDTKYACGEQRSRRDVQAKAAKDGRGVVDDGVYALDET